MSGAPGNPKTQSEGELKAARTMNTVATIGAVHAAHASAAKDFPKYAAADQRVKRAAAKVVPTGVRRRVAAVGGKAGHAGGKAGAAVGAGWLGFHGAEFAGDIMARRTINNALDAKRQQKDGGVAKGVPAQVTVAKSATSADGVGTSLDAPVRKGRSNRQKETKRGLAEVYGGSHLLGTAAGAAWLHREGATGAKQPRGTALRDAVALARGKETYVAAPPKRVLGAASRREAAGAPTGPTHVRLTPGVALRRNSRAAVAAAGVGMAAGGVKLISDGTERVGRAQRPAKKIVAKAYRRFDPEADRQRRIGAAQGVLTGTALVTGDRATRSLTTEVSNRGARVPGVALRRGASKKRALAWGAASVASGAGAVAAHRHGVSQRNQPWT